MAPLLQVDDVSMSFGGVHALSGVSFTLRQGDVISIRISGIGELVNPVVRGGPPEPVGLD